MQFFRLFCLLALPLALPLAAGAVPSDPVGIFNLRLRGNSDTLVSLPLLRPALVEAAITSRTGSTFLLAADMPALPAGGAYALVLSGALEGAVLPVTGVDGRTVTVVGGADDLGSLHTETVQGDGLGDIVALIPYWTLDTVFPGGQGVNISASSSTRTTEVLLFDRTIAGTNLSAAETFFYFEGNDTKPAGWYKVGATTAPLGTRRLDPGTYFIVRHNIAGDTALLLAGGVQMAAYRVPLAVIAADTAQDNLLALSAATPVSLSSSSLIASGAFAVSTGSSASTRGDELFVFENTQITKNKSAAATYFYFTGSPTKPAGWYQVGNTNAPVSPTLLPGEGFIIRKKARPAAGIDIWSDLPGYLN